MKSLRLNPSFRRLALAISAFTALALSSRAFADPVVVSSADITNGTYDFTVTQGDYNTTPPPYALGNYDNNASGDGPGLIDASNLTYVTDYLADYFAGYSSNSADLILGFDFAGSGYAPTSLTLTSNAVDFTDSSTFTFSYSTDGGFTYTTFATATAVAPYLEYGITIVPPLTVSLADLPSDVDVEIAVSNPGGLNNINSQIGRSYPDGVTALDYSFAVEATPEPSTFAMVGLGLAIVGLRFWRRTKSLEA